MVFKNPLILVTIPLALALSVIWFRRKKLCDTGGDSREKTATTVSSTTNSELNRGNNTNNDQHRDLKHSISVPIGNTPKKLNTSLGKSAPIDITPHKTSPTRSKNGSNESNDKNDGSDYKALNSIEENSLDSVDLPGSINCRRRFSFTIRTNEPQVVVKATAMDAKDVNKSPQSSFETLITSPTNDAKPSAPKAISSKSTPITTSSKVKNSEKKAKNEKKSIVNESTNTKDSKKPARVLPVASPPLSLCSNKSNQSHDSGDSGKGSSPANSEGGNTLSSIQSYDFELPQGAVGFLVGKGGATLHKIRDECNVNISINRHPIKYKKYKLCTLQGTQKQIDDALAMIKSRMPPKTNLERVDIELETAEMLAAISQIDSNRLQVIYEFNLFMYSDFCIHNSQQQFL